MASGMGIKSRSFALNLILFNIGLKQIQAKF
jgi:hypothetical protein